MEKINGRIAPANIKETANKQHVVCLNCGKKQRFKKVFGCKTTCIKCGKPISRQD